MIDAAWAAGTRPTRRCQGQISLERHVGEVVERAVDVAAQVDARRERARVELLAVDDVVGADDAGTPMSMTCESTTFRATRADREHHRCTASQRTGIEGTSGPARSRGRRPATACARRT